MIKFYFSDISFEELKDKLDDVYIIDVRTEGELKTRGWIPNSVHMDCE